MVLLSIRLILRFICCVCYSAFEGDDETEVEEAGDKSEAEDGKEETKGPGGDDRTGNELLWM